MILAFHGTAWMKSGNRQYFVCSRCGRAMKIPPPNVRIPDWLYPIVDEIDPETRLPKMVKYLCKTCRRE
jgi:DNA-directed RNA polymerase subunit RPC12/RpoP